MPIQGYGYEGHFATAEGHFLRERFFWSQVLFPP